MTLATCKLITQRPLPKLHTLQNSDCRPVQAQDMPGP